MRSAAYRANLLKLGVMALLVLAACAAYLLVDVNPKYFDYAMSLRVPKLIVMLIAAFAIGGASLVFQSVINNTIVTPCLLGMNSLYTLIHTAVVFVAGSGSILAVNANAAFAVDLVIMGLSATVIYGYSGGRTTPEDQRIIDQAISYMELEKFQDRFIDELSGGQRQRALIAMVIAQDTEYVLLDEPTNNLDIYHATNMMRTVRKLCDELGKTVILVLHEINYAAFYSDYICAFVDGKVAKFGTVEEVMTKENLSAIYQVDFEILEIEGKPLSIYY